MKLVFRPQAQEDLLTIYEYIAEDSPANETRFIDRLESVCALLAEQPRMGKVRLELQPAGIHSFPADDYLIFYWVQGDTLEVINIIHASRDYLAHFQCS